MKEMDEMKYLNVGCGSTFHSAWENIDVNPSSPEVKAYDIRKDLPYENNIFDAAYCSHVLEHLRRDEALQLLGEVRRVLRPGGIFRLVVPDLETIARVYLEKLEAAYQGNVGAEADYEWMMLELYDQTVREKGGGEMLHYLTNKNIENKDFVLSRVGKEAEQFFTTTNDASSNSKENSKLPSKSAIRNLRQSLACYLVRLIGGNEASRSFEEGLFRNSGEVHRWMYDRFSINRLLRDMGFDDITICAARESKIVDFNEFGLDTINGEIRKPDSLFIESVKPKKAPVMMDMMYMGENLVSIEGFGPPEGPYPHLHLPQIMWGYGPECRITIYSGYERKIRLYLNVQNYFADQIMKIYANNELIKEIPVVVNFANNQGNFQKVGLKVKLAKGINAITFTYSKWEAQNDRPMSVVFSKLSTIRKVGGKTGLIINAKRKLLSKNTNIYHCCIQKTASQWLKRIFSDPVIEECSNLEVHSPEKDFIVSQENRQELSEPFPEKTIVSPLYSTYEDFQKIPKPNKYKAFWVMRDPRDILVSQFFSITYSHKIISEGMEKTRNILQSMKTDEAFSYFLEYVYPIKNPDLPYFVALKSWLKSLKNKKILLCRYEDLVGTTQLKTFQVVLEHCNIYIPATVIKDLLEKYSFKRLSRRWQGVEDKLSHFRKGVAGDWRNYFTDEIKDSFKQSAGQLLIDLGYEKDLDW